MKNNPQKYHVIKSVSKHKKEKSTVNKMKINNTFIINHSKKANIINIKRMLINRVQINSKYKTNKNSRKYKYSFIKYIN